MLNCYPQKRCLPYYKFMVKMIVCVLDNNSLCDIPCVSIERQRLSMEYPRSGIFNYQIANELRELVGNKESAWHPCSRR